MTLFIIAFLSGALTSLTLCLGVSLVTGHQRHAEVSAAIEEARRRAYARGYEEGNLHGRGQFILRNQA